MSAPTEQEIVASKVSELVKKSNNPLYSPPDSTDSTDVGVQYKDYRPLYEEFGLKEHNFNARTNEILHKIWEYAEKNSPNKDRNSVLLEVIRLKNKLGTPSQSEPSYQRVWNYVFAANQQQQATQVLEEMNG